MCANSEGSGETAPMRRLAWAFAGRLCDKYHNLMSRLILRYFQNENKVEENDPELAQLELGGNKLGVREITYLFDFVASYPPLVSIVSILQN